jgi:hypothetical protein
MSTHITGKLILAGDYTEEEQIDPAEPLARVVVVMTREQLRDVATLPMYEEVTVIRSDELAALRADRARLDWLEKRRIALNVHCGSSYGWEVVQSHLVNRLMLRTPEVCAMAGVDVNDTGAGGKDIRQAIDDAMRASSLANNGDVEHRGQKSS